MAAQYDFTDCRQNDTFPGAGFQLTDDAETPVPLDLTGVSIAVKFTRRPDDTPGRLLAGGKADCISLTSTPDDGIEITDAPAGKWLITPFLWERGPGVWDYDAALTYPSGRVATILAGTLTITPDLICA
jgi:hypothetical protein